MNMDLDILNERDRAVELLRRSFARSINELDRIGTSKRTDRGQATAKRRKAAIAAGVKKIDAKRLHAPPKFIHSKISKIGYKAICKRFAGWLVDNHPEVTKIGYAHRKGFDAEWIATFANADTQKTYRAALAKVYRCAGEDICDTNKRAAPVKGRWFDPEYDYPVMVEKYGALTEFGRMTGARREELPNITPECFVKKPDGLHCIFDGKEQDTKGGRGRDALILPDDVERLMEIVGAAAPGAPVFPLQLESNYNEQALRRMYAAGIYSYFARPLTELEDKRVPITPKYDASRGSWRYDAPAIFEPKNGKRFDRWALGKGAACLGHGEQRIDTMRKYYTDYIIPE